MKRWLCVILACMAIACPVQAEAISWVDFRIPYESLKYAMEKDIVSAEKDKHISWIDILSLAACRTGGACDLSAVKKAAKDLESDCSPKELCGNLHKYFDHYREAYTAVLGGLLGNFEVEIKGAKVQKYGLKAFSPIAEGYGYSHSDDFGNSRSFGFKRKHLGHDMMGTEGTPVIAVEGGIVEAIGWNRYGGENMRARINAFIRKHAAEGHQSFVVCPAVEENEELGVKAAEAWAQTLQQTVFPDLRILLIHGRMKGAEKEAVMAAFARGEADVLVATTVIEVGVDVPNATLMIIEDADRFGLSQLHQLRGRVGRGKAKSYCILTSSTKSAQTIARLKALCATTDGFKIAEEDLALRGPGDFFGSRQSGLPVFRVANLSCDLQTLKQAQIASAQWIDRCGTEATPEAEALRSRIRELFLRSQGTMN